MSFYTESYTCEATSPKSKLALSSKSRDLLSHVISECMQMLRCNSTKTILTKTILAFKVALVSHAAPTTTSATPASSQEISLLTSAIQPLTKNLPGPLNSSLAEEKRYEKGKGKWPASSAANAVPAKKSRATEDKESGARNSMSASADSNDRQALYDAVVNSKDDESEHETTRSGDEDEVLSELVKEYESDDTVGVSLKSEQLAQVVNKMFRCK